MKSVRWAKGAGSTAAGTASTLRAYWSLSPMVWVRAAEMDGVTVRSGDAGMRRSRESRCSWYAPASLRNCGGEERKGAEALPQGTVRSESQSVAGQRKGGAGGWLPTWTRVRGGPHRRRPASFSVLYLSLLRVCHGVMARLSLVPKDVPFSGGATVYPLASRRTARWLLSLGNYEQSCCKHPCAGFM